MYIRPVGNSMGASGLTHSQTWELEEVFIVRKSLILVVLSRYIACDCCIHVMSVYMGAFKRGEVNRSRYTLLYV